MELVLNCVGLEPGGGLEPAYRVAAEHGIGWLELFHDRNWTLENGERVMEEVAERGLRVSAVDGWTQLYREDGFWQPSREVLMRQIELAAFAGAPYAITYFGHAAERDDDRAIATYRDRLAPCLERAEELGVTILLENEFDGLGHDPAESDVTRRPDVVRDLIEQVGSARFRTNFDASNYYFSGVEPYPYAYTVLRDVIDYVHVKDGRRLGRYGPAHDDAKWDRRMEHAGEVGWCEVGEGAINWDGLLRALRTDGFTGFVALEPHCWPAHAEEAWRQSIAFVKPRFVA
jgi:sugar phosphate isomerase/epimerase